ncbi:TPA: Rha family transcriptional regulator [Campylobacter coli]|nr:phage regulatory protein [Campylobacter coli]HAN0655987.1 phage regulatory protein [Campylobacter coli]HAN0707489.1 phage regulatory protein [Campylobacter coli]HDX3700596.1 Rha family transcriptional regulator [Campylobacter coli]HED6644448.1 Rha family transcriptional regulator [Campylobacter coli]
MNNVVFINNQEVVFENKDEQVFCTSLDVAKVFGKNHFHVLRDIENILNNLRKIGTSQDLSNFGLVKYKDKKGELRPVYQNEILNQITCTQSSTIYVLQDSIRFLNNTISSMKEINKELKKIAGIDRFL